MVACLAVSVAGCGASYPAPPMQTFRPKIVGVIDTVNITRSCRWSGREDLRRHNRHQSC
jgi:hypothetical protein